MSNLASGTTEQTKVLIDAGVIPIFVRFLSSEYPEIAAQVNYSFENKLVDADLFLLQGDLGNRKHFWRLCSQQRQDNQLWRCRSSR